jgi:alpha-beta hydrolase superfamily lysophospholipase
MAGQRPVLIIIPGIGDDIPIYYRFAKRWERFGYEVHVISYGWAEHYMSEARKTSVFKRRLEPFTNRPLYIIGVSAGGTVAVRLLAELSNVRKVITVCSPLDTMPGLDNPLLAANIAQVKTALAGLDASQKARILSTHAVYDQTVDIRLSQPTGIANWRIPAVIHAVAIFVAMQLYARHLQRFFQR